MPAAADLKIGFIGCGRMATAIAGGLIAAGFVRSEQICGSDPSADCREKFSTATGASVGGDNKEVVQGATVAILAVKPQHMGQVLEEIASHVTSKSIVVSIAAGVTLSQLAQALGEKQRLIRVMPNTPCLVQQGASAFARGGSASPADARLVSELLSTVGVATEVPESLLDAVTGLSGSGPAYVFQIIEALSDGGVAAGLPRQIATQFAAQTVLGAAKMVLETGEHPGALKDAVASPGGTTIAGLLELERGGLRAALMNAVVSATQRSKQLGEAAGKR